MFNNINVPLSMDMIEYLIMAFKSFTIVALNCSTTPTYSYNDSISYFDFSNVSFSSLLGSVNRYRRFLMLVIDRI